MTDGADAGNDAGWSRGRVRLGLFAVGLILLLGSPFWVPLVLRQLSFFRVRKVEIIGARYVSVSELMDRLHVDTSVSVWDPTGPMVARLAADPQLRSVNVRRKLPGTLVVDIQESLPIALVSTNDGLRAYDERGILLPIDLARTPIDVPILPRRDLALLHLLGVLRNEAPTLYDRLSEIRITAPDEVLLQFAGTPVRAMRDVSPARLTEIAPVEDDLTRRGLHAAEIDLRYRDQVIARLP
ncbi:MAG TPA: FtsQ-type POTRA domain-containing protein [Gemmatimonadaceae bacterium]|nr:FtsQ-type POTRA domain-containing protein [Gemmatimonadaceae bacterium]